MEKINENTEKTIQDTVAEEKEERRECEGILEIMEGGFGFLRFDNFLTSENDIYVANSQIRRFNLKTGDKVGGIARSPRQNERFGGLLQVLSINGEDPEKARKRPDFDRLTPVYPDRRIKFEYGGDASMRLLDLVAPSGFGQRGLIVAQPKAGKTVLMKKIAASIENNYPDAELIILLIDERPEEVTDMKRSLKKGGEVIYSTFDEQPSHHVKVAEMVLARAQRLAEQGKDVIILMDSITRLARAYNLVMPSSGRTLSGGLDPASLYRPKKFFGAARNFEEGGSVTILATALVETGSRMDDVIYEEFKGTGNMELHLDRRMAERRIFPAVNIRASGTRKEELLMEPEELKVSWEMRRIISGNQNYDIYEKLVRLLEKTEDFSEFGKLIGRLQVQDR